MLSFDDKNNYGLFNFRFNHALHNLLLSVNRAVIQSVITKQNFFLVFLE